MLGTLLIAAVAVYATVVGALYLGQERLLFLPNVAGRQLSATPSAMGLKYTDLSIATDDGETLHGWLIPAGDSRRLLIFFHGNAGNISHRLDSIAVFHRLGLDVLIVDYRGYGQSSGSPGEAGIQRDAEAVWRYATESLDYAATSTALIGRSMGGSVAAWLASRTEPAALILESAFTSVPDMAAELYPVFPTRLLARLRLDTLDYLRTVHCPVLIVHSRNDELIPFHHGQSLYEAAPEPRYLLETRGDHNHGFLQSGALYTDGLRRFLDTYVPGHTGLADGRL